MPTMEDLLSHGPLKHMEMLPVPTERADPSKDVPAVARTWADAVGYLWSETWLVRGLRSTAGLKDMKISMGEIVARVIGTEPSGRVVSLRPVFGFEKLTMAVYLGDRRVTGLVQIDYDAPPMPPCVPAWVLARLDHIEKAPGMWGGPEAVEVLYLTLLELLWDHTHGQGAGRRVQDAWQNVIKGAHPEVGCALLSAHAGHEELIRCLRQLRDLVLIADAIATGKG